MALAEERARIARDLHDSAGHAINVIALRAGADRLRHTEDADRSLRALEVMSGDLFDRTPPTLAGALANGTIRAARRAR